MENDQDDALLVNNYLKGCDKSFEILYRRHKGIFYAHIIGMLNGNQAVADDLFQQSWIKIVKNLSRYQERQLFRAWGMRICHNTVLDFFRKEKRQKETSVEEIPIALKEKKKSRWSDSEFQQELTKAIALLPHEQKEVFILRRQDISFKQIATIQDCSINTVLGRMQYAMKKLKQELCEWQN